VAVRLRGSHSPDVVQLAETIEGCSGCGELARSPSVGVALGIEDRFEPFVDALHHSTRLDLHRSRVQRGSWVAGAVAGPKCGFDLKGSCTFPSLIPSTSARFVHDPLKPWRRPSAKACEGRNVLWHTLWSESHSNPRYAELVPRLRDLFFAPIRQRGGVLGRLDGGIARRSLFLERRVLDWYRRSGIRLLLTPSPAQAPMFAGPVVLDLDDPARTSAEQAALCAPNLRHVVVPTDAIAQYVQESNPRLGITIVPQGVDIDRVSRAHAADTRRMLLASRDLPYETAIVGYHAPIICLSEEKAFKDERFQQYYIDVLLRAVHKLWSDNLSFLTILVGKASPAIEQLTLYERRLVLTDYIDRSRLFDWIGTFDIGTYPRTVDFSGRQSVKLLEYMASGAAIMAMPTSETQFVEDIPAGYTASNQDEFCHGLRSLITNGEARHTFAEHGRQFAANYDWRMLGARYDTILADAANTE
jgi:glycosyltransferase involved in cell wall biosynthesis